MRYLQIFLLIFGAISLVLSGTSHAFTVPEGWKVLSTAEFMNEIRKEESKDYLSVQGDFNGDGVEDEARLLVTNGGRKMGVVVWLSDRDQKKLFILGEYDAWPKGTGVDLVKPGQYKTACGKGYFDCGPGEPEILVLDKDAINYFRFESANSFFYWDIANKAFKRIWMSD